MAPLASVLVDARQLSGEYSGGGIATYVRELLSALPATGLDVRALATADATVPAGVTVTRIRRRFAGGRSSMIEQKLRQPLELLRHRASVFHNPYAGAPLWAPRPWVQTLHDVIPLVVDDPMMAAIARRMRRDARQYAAADAVVAVTRHAADDGIRVLGIDPARIEVVHHAAGPAFRPDPDDRPDDADPYVLVVSEFQKRKGFDRAVFVSDALADASLPHRLRFAGRIAQWSRPQLEAVVAAARHPERIDLLGFVDDLPSVYRRASVCIVPSLYEGFGLPVLEAMACGTPVIAFDNSSLPEVVGDAGVLVPEGDVIEMATQVVALLRDERRRMDLSAAGSARAATFTWDRCAALHAEIYRSLMA